MSQESQENQEQGAEKRSVLIIEDEVFILDLLVHKFKEQGWKIASAMQAEDGMKKLEDKPDLVLLDILLPGMNGYEFLEKIMNDETTKDIPVLVLSNYGQRSEVEKSIELGAVDHLVKANIIIEEVVDRAEKILGKGKQSATSEDKQATEDSTEKDDANETSDKRPELDI